VIATAWFGFTTWREVVVERQRDRALTGVQQLIAEARWSEARGAVRAFWRDYGNQLSENEKLTWRELDIESSEQSRDLTRLVWLESRYPDLVHGRETASLLITRTFAAAGQFEESDRLREAWRGREENPELWLALDVDRLLAASKPDEARLLLESMKFAGEADLGRQLRLALLAPTPLEAWAALNEAVRIDPTNADARSFRAQILERAGATEAARVEYVAALVANPEDPVRRDQLAQFYRRHGGTAQALQTWRDGLTPTAPDFFWLRTLLWERLFGAGERAVPEASAGVWSSLIEALTELPPDRFWSEAAIADPAQARLAAERPEVELLSLLENLREGREGAAATDAAALSPSTHVLAPAGIAVVQAVLRWRATALVPAWGDLPAKLPGLEEHVLIDQLREWPGEALPPETATLLSGPHAWTALMLGSGWPQAALIMAGEGLTTPAQEVPEWYHYGLAVALRQNEGAIAALTYLQAVPATPALQLLAAEIGWTQESPEARGQLETLATNSGDVGYRAAWLLAVDALGRADWAQAQAWIEEHPGLVRSVTGRELLARTALSSGRPEQAAAIYTELGTSSLEAGMYLSRVAFTAGDWAQARELTEALMADFPAQIELRRNLEKITAAEQAAEGVTAP